MKVKRFQQGGGFLTYTPFITGSSVGALNQSGSGSSDSKESGPKNSTGILDDEIYKKLINEGGLVNDVDYLVEKLYNLQNSSLNPFLDSNNSSSAIRMISEINRLRSSNEIWKNARSSAISQDSLGEVAVGNYGEVFIKDKNNKVKSITLNEYKKNKSELRLLTNAELLHERNQNPNLVGNDSISTVVGSSVGIKKITNHIKSIISAFGSTSFSDERMYTKEQAQENLKKIGQTLGETPTKEQADAIRTLYSVLESPGDYVKIKESKSSERTQALKAVKYIWNTLGDASQKKLSATSVVNGVDNPLEFILDMVTNQTNETSTLSILGAFDKNSSKSGTGSGTGSRGSTEKERAETPFELMHNGRTGKDSFIWNDPATKKKMNLVATGTGVLTEKDGKPIPMSSLKSVLNTELATLLDVNNIYYGDQKVGLNDLSNILYDGKLAARVFMPIGNNGMPDYDKLARVKELEEQIANSPELTPEQINQIFANNGLEYIEVDGQKHYKENENFRAYLVFNGVTGNKANAIKNNSRLNLMLKDSRDAQVTAMEEVWEEGKISKKPVSKWGMGDYYSGLVAIPYKRDSFYYTRAISGNLFSPQTTLQEAREQELINSGTVINGSSEWLFNNM